jgi:hypothetical protein
MMKSIKEGLRSSFFFFLNIFSTTRQIIDAYDLCKSREIECRTILFELYFTCISPHFPDDYTIKLFIAVYNGNVNDVKEALNNGGDKCLTDIAIFNKYSKTKESILQCFIPWRHLFLILNKSFY